MTRHNRQVSLASSYAPVLIDRTHSHSHSDPAAVGTTTDQASLKYPYPLALLGVADIAYTAYTFHTSKSASLPTHLLALSILRATVLALALGASTSWRSRGGWVGSISVVSLGSVVWEGCKGQLLRRGDVDEKLDTRFLVITALLAIIEFISFMLLLRLSPPPTHRPHPFSLRVPPSAVQSPTAFTYSEQTADMTSPTPWRSFHAVARAGETEDGDEDESDMESVSSISESSIIDLPPPLEPNRLLPPSVSLTTGLSLAALDDSPIIGPLVRRTRSARFSTIRSLGRWESAGNDQDRDASSGYGTFGTDAQQNEAASRA